MKKVFKLSLLCLLYFFAQLSYSEDSPNEQEPSAEITETISSEVRLDVDNSEKESKIKLEDVPLPPEIQVIVN